MYIILNERTRREYAPHGTIVAFDDTEFDMADTICTHMNFNALPNTPWHVKKVADDYKKDLTLNYKYCII